MAKASTGLDDALSLDAVYYSAQIPRDLAVLTVMGAVFDTIYFPGVYMPTENFDQTELDKEIERLKALPPGSGRNTANLIGMLSFIRHARIGSRGSNYRHCAKRCGSVAVARQRSVVG